MATREILERQEAELIEKINEADDTDMTDAEWWQLNRQLAEVQFAMMLLPPPETVQTVWGAITY